MVVTSSRAIRIGIDRTLSSKQFGGIITTVEVPAGGRGRTVEDLLQVLIVLVGAFACIQDVQSGRWTICPLECDVDARIVKPGARGDSETSHGWQFYLERAISNVQQVDGCAG